MAMPCGMCIDTRSPEQMCYIGELSSVWWTRGLGEFWEAWNRPGMGPRVSIYSLDGKLQARLCDNGQGENPGQLIAPPGMAGPPPGDTPPREHLWPLPGTRVHPSA